MCRHVRQHRPVFKEGAPLRLVMICLRFLLSTAYIVLESIVDDWITTAFCFLHALSALQAVLLRKRTILVILAVAAYWAREAFSKMAIRAGKNRFWHCEGRFELIQAIRTQSSARTAGL